MESDRTSAVMENREGAANLQVDTASGRKTAGRHLVE